MKKYKFAIIIILALFILGFAFKLIYIKDGTITEGTYPVVDFEQYPDASITITFILLSSPIRTAFHTISKQSAPDSVLARSESLLFYQWDLRAHCGFPAFLRPIHQ